MISRNQTAVLLHKTKLVFLTKIRLELQEKVAVNVPRNV